MQKLKSKIILLLLLNFLVILLFNQGVLAKPENIEPTTNSKIEIEGFRLQYTENGELQALVDISLEDVNVTGIGFDLAYDSKYIKPSTYDTNEVTNDVSQFFYPNPVVFPEAPNEGAYGPKFKAWLNYGSSKIYDNHIDMTILPDVNSPEKYYVGTTEINVPERKIVKTIKTAGTKAMIGTMSFQVVDVDGLAALSEDEVKNILKVKNNTKGALVIYADKDKIERFKNIVVPMQLKYVPIEKPDVVIYLMGKVRTLLPTIETVIDVYRYDEEGNQVDAGPIKSYASLTQTDEGIEGINGSTWIANGSFNGIPFAEWDFRIPLSMKADDKYTYKMDIRKVSHKRKEDIALNLTEVKVDSVSKEKSLGITEGYKNFIPLLPGDFNDDGFVNDVDRSYIMQQYNRVGADAGVKVTDTVPNGEAITYDLTEIYDFNTSGIVDMMDVELLKYCRDAYLYESWNRPWTKVYQKSDETELEDTKLERFKYNNSAHRVQRVYE